MQKWKLPTKPKALNWFVSVNQSCSDANYFVYTQPLKMWFQLSSEFQAFFVVLSIGLATPFVSIVGARRYLAFFFFFSAILFFWGAIFNSVCSFRVSICFAWSLSNCFHSTSTMPWWWCWWWWCCAYIDIVWGNAKHRLNAQLCAAEHSSSQSISIATATRHLYRSLHFACVLWSESARHTIQLLNVLKSIALQLG